MAIAEPIIPPPPPGFVPLRKNPSGNRPPPPPGFIPMDSRRSPPPGFVPVNGSRSTPRTSTAGELPPDVTFGNWQPSPEQQRQTATGQVLRPEFQVDPSTFTETGQQLDEQFRFDPKTDKDIRAALQYMIDHEPGTKFEKAANTVIQSAADGLLGVTARPVARLFKAAALQNPKLYDSEMMRDWINLLADDLDVVEPSGLSDAQRRVLGGVRGAAKIGGMAAGLFGPLSILSPPALLGRVGAAAGGAVAGTAGRFVGMGAGFTAGEAVPEALAGGKLGQAGKAGSAVGAAARSPVDFALEVVKAPITVGKLLTQWSELTPDEIRESVESLGTPALAGFGAFVSRFRAKQFGKSLEIKPIPREAYAKLSAEKYYWRLINGGPADVNALRTYLRDAPPKQQAALRDMIATAAIEGSSAVRDAITRGLIGVREGRVMIGEPPARPGAEVRQPARGVRVSVAPGAAEPTKPTGVEGLLGALDRAISPKRIAEVEVLARDAKLTPEERYVVEGEIRTAREAFGLEPEAAKPAQPQMLGFPEPLGPPTSARTPEQAPATTAKLAPRVEKLIRYMSSLPAKDVSLGDRKSLFGAVRENPQGAAERAEFWAADESATPAARRGAFRIAKMIRKEFGLPETVAAPPEAASKKLAPPRQKPAPIAPVTAGERAGAPKASETTRVPVSQVEALRARAAAGQTELKPQATKEVSRETPVSDKMLAESPGFIPPEPSPEALGFMAGPRIRPPKPKVGGKPVAPPRDVGVAPGQSVWNAAKDVGGRLLGGIKESRKLGARIERATSKFLGRKGIGELDTATMMRWFKKLKEGTESPRELYNIHQAVVGRFPMEELPQGVRLWAERARIMMDDASRVYAAELRYAFGAESEATQGVERRIGTYLQEVKVPERPLKQLQRWATKQIKADPKRLKLRRGTEGEPGAWQVRIKRTPYRFDTKAEARAFMKELIYQKKDTLIKKQAKEKGVTPDDIKNAALRYPPRLKRPLTEAERIEQRFSRDPRFVLGKSYLDTVHNAAVLRMARELGRTYIREIPADVKAGGESAIAEWAKTNGLERITGRPDKIGVLSEKYVPKRLARNINSMYLPKTVIGAIWRNYISVWKFSKVVANPATWMTNILGNVMFAHFAGILPPPFAPWNSKYYIRAAQDILNKGPAYRALLRRHEIGGEFYGQEIKANIIDPVLRGESFDTVLFKRVGGGARAMGRSYNAIDQVFKVAAYLKYIDKGMKPLKALREVAFWFPNYSKITRFTKAVGQTPLGGPFLAFTDQAIQIQMRAMTRPGSAAKLLGWWALPGVLTQFSRWATGMGDDEYEMANRKRGYFEPLLPWRDADGSLPTLGLGYIIPLGSEASRIGELLAGEHGGGINLPFALANPVAGDILEVFFNKDLFTGKPLSKPTDSLGTRVKNGVFHILRGAAPLPNILMGGQERIRRAFGPEPKESVVRAIGGALFGINVRKPYVGSREAYDSLVKLAEQNPEVAKVMQQIVGGNIGDIPYGRLMRNLDAFDRFQELLQVYNEAWRQAHDPRITPRSVLESAVRRVKAPRAPFVDAFWDAVDAGNESAMQKNADELRSAGYRTSDLIRSAQNRGHQRDIPRLRKFFDKPQNKP